MLLTAQTCSAFDPESASSAREKLRKRTRLEVLFSLSSCSLRCRVDQKLFTKTAWDDNSNFIGLSSDFVDDFHAAFAVFLSSRARWRLDEENLSQLASDSSSSSLFRLSVMRSHEIAVGGDNETLTELHKPRVDSRAAIKVNAKLLQRDSFDVSGNGIWMLQARCRDKRRNQFGLNAPFWWHNSVPVPVLLYDTEPGLLSSSHVA